MRKFIGVIKTKFSKILNRETMLYAFFGIMTSIMNVVLFKVLLSTGMVYTVANLITLICVKITAYICNKNFVFRSKCPDFIGKRQINDV